MPAKSEIKTLEFEDAFAHHMLEPTMFDKKAYNHKDPEQHAKWHATIRKEFKDMNICEVWCKAKQSTIPKGQCCSIKFKWVFKIKRDAHSRLDCHIQIQPDHQCQFTKTYAPVMNDITWHILLACSNDCMEPGFNYCWCWNGFPAWRTGERNLHESTRWYGGLQQWMIPAQDTLCIGARGMPVVEENWWQFSRTLSSKEALPILASWSSIQTMEQCLLLCILMTTSDSRSLWRTSRSKASLWRWQRNWQIIWVNQSSSLGLGSCISLEATNKFGQLVNKMQS